MIYFLRKNYYAIWNSCNMFIKVFLKTSHGTCLSCSCKNFLLEVLIFPCVYFVFRAGLVLCFVFWFFGVFFFFFLILLKVLYLDYFVFTMWQCIAFPASSQNMSPAPMLNVWVSLSVFSSIFFKARASRVTHTLELWCYILLFPKNSDGP